MTNESKTPLYHRITINPGDARDVVVYHAPDPLAFVHGCAVIKLGGEHVVIIPTTQFIGAESKPIFEEPAATDEQPAEVVVAEPVANRTPARKAAPKRRRR